MEDLMRMLDYQKQGLFCSQILVSLGLADRGEDNPELVRAARGLAGGLGFAGQTCGALSGGACLLALYAGNAPGDVMDPRHDMMVQELVAWFSAEYGERYGDITCDAILEGDLKNTRARCPEIVVSVYQKAGEILAEHGFSRDGEDSLEQD